MRPEVLALEKKYENRMEFITADVTTSEGNFLAGQFNVDLLPRFLVFDRKGSPLFSETGAQTKQVLENDIIQVINKQ